ncbi:MAG: MarR family transcriptional regulator [Marinomonas sp.]|uniref:MarR family transcriptional regulator n=1 Tax=Marinomonas sp. TaxID=1904862 RepID=UPI003F9A6B28
MTNITHELAKAENALEQAEEMNAVEALNDASSQGDNANIDVGLILGRIQMSQTIAKFADVVTLSALKEIKETKRYRALKGKVITVSDDVGEKQVVLKGTWDEFCSLCHASKSSVDERLMNLELFGENALQSMQLLGMTTRDLRKLRKLPEEELKAIVDDGEIKVSDREEALDLIEEMAHKHRTEKAGMQQSIAKLEQDNQSNERLLSDKDKKINTLTKQLEAQLTPVERRKKEEELHARLRSELSVSEIDIDKGIARLGDAIQTIQETSSSPTDLNEACGDAVYHALSRLLDMALDLGMAEPALRQLESFKDNAELMNLA